MRHLGTMILALALVLFAAGIAGCDAGWMDDAGGWTAQDDGQGFSGGDWMHCDPEIEARAELY